MTVLWELCINLTRSGLLSGIEEVSFFEMKIQKQRPLTCARNSGYDIEPDWGLKPREEAHRSQPSNIAPGSAVESKTSDYIHSCV